MSLLEQIFSAGVIGAGGAGFPTHKKLTDQADTVIINAAECEPLLTSDRYVMRHYAPEIVAALKKIKNEFGFKSVVIGIKAKYDKEIAALQNAMEDAGASFLTHTTSSFYPAGDEQTLIYEITGKTVPPGGIPLALGIVVVNVTTVLHVWQAVQGLPVTRRFVMVTGEVEEPTLVDAPIGTSFKDCIDAAGGTKLTDFTIVRGGPMMGKQLHMQEGLQLSTGKTDGGLIVLDTEHPLIQFSKKSVPHMINQAKSVCIQCSYCTQMCPRYLIGHQLRPHRVMRSMAAGQDAALATEALLCCECGICELYACPMLLSPRRINMYVKDVLREKKIRDTDRTVYPEHAEMRGYRSIAQSRLISRLALTPYPTEMDKVTVCEPKRVCISTKQGIGKPATPTVKKGDLVQLGDVIAKVNFEDVGCVVHASMKGRVADVNEDGIVIEREGGTAE